MEVQFESSFQRDLKKIGDRQILGKIKEAILSCKESEKLEDLPNLKKLKGYKNFYRIRVKTYRIGIEYVDGILIFTRCLARKDIYRFFP